MKIRHGLVLAMTIGLGLVGCASGGGGGGGSGGVGLEDLLAAGASEGEAPRETDNTDAAAQALEAAGDAEEAGDAQQAEMHYQQALSAAEAAIAEDATNPLAHRLAGMAAMGLEEYETAGEHFDEAIELRPIYEFELVEARETKWIELYQEANPYIQSGEYETAVDYFEDADAIYQGRPEVMITLGQLHAQLRNHDQAIEAIDRALAFEDSEYIEAVDSATAASWREQMEELPLLKGQVLADAGRFEEAVTVYEGLVAENPEDVELKRGLAAILMELGRQDEAFAVYDELLTMPGLDSPTLFSIGVGFYQGENYGRAAEAFGAAAEQSVNDRDALEMWTRSLQLDSAYSDVPAVAERWIELDPNSRNGWTILAQATNQLGDQEATQEAIRMVESLEVSVRDLQMARYGNGGASVTGSLVNHSLDPGTSVTLRFTFYDDQGAPLGTVTETLSAGQVDMAEVVQVEFESTEQVGGYGYELTVG